MDPYIKLANSIIVQAVEDLKSVNKNIEKCENRIKEYENDFDRLELEEKKLFELKGKKKALDRFFKSDWFVTLCDLSGLNSEYLVQEIEKRNNNGK